MVYSQAGDELGVFFIAQTNLYSVRSPLDRLDINHQFLDGWELALYIMALSFALEGNISSSTLGIKLILVPFRREQSNSVLYCPSSDR